MLRRQGFSKFLIPGASGAGPPTSVVGGASAGVWVVGILSSPVPPAAILSSLVGWWEKVRMERRPVGFPSIL